MRKLLHVAAALAVLMVCGGSALAAGDAAKGKADFTTALCATCHQIGPGAKNLVGPELNGIVGRKAASIARPATIAAQVDGSGTVLLTIGRLVSMWGVDRGATDEGVAACAAYAVFDPRANLASMSFISSAIPSKTSSTRSAWPRQRWR